MAWIGEWIEAKSRPSLAASASIASPVIGAGVGLGLWMLYCLAVTSWPWPNTAYVKASVGQDASLGGGLDYFMETVFNYPTLAECYKVAALDAHNRLLL